MPNDAATCPFCGYSGPKPLLAKSNDSYVIEPLKPAVLAQPGQPFGHALVIPFAHVEDFAEEMAVTAAVAADAAAIAQEWPGDWNLIASKGPAATQTIRHLHFHLIRRRKGDGLPLPWSFKRPQLVVGLEPVEVNTILSAFNMCRHHGGAAKYADSVEDKLRALLGGRAE